MDAQALTSLLIRWANINSGSENIAGLERMRLALAETFGTLPGAQVQHLALPDTEARALQVRVRSDAPIQLLLSGHYDTVYGPEHHFQTCAPLAGTHLNGPGVADMKGGLIVMLAALQRFERHPQRSQIGWEILLTPDEETGSAHSARLLAEASNRHTFALVFEPARGNGDLVRSRMGTGIFTVICRGRAAHAGRDPNAGRNAIVALAEVIPQIHALNAELPGVLINVGSIAGGGAVNIVPDLAAAEINIRVKRSSDAEGVLHRLKAIAGPINAREGYAMEISGRFNRGPKEATPLEERMFEAWQACTRESGFTVGWQDVGGGSDGNILATAGLRSLDGIGIVGDHLHSPREFADVASILPRASAAALFMERIAGGTISFV